MATVSDRRPTGTGSPRVELYVRALAAADGRGPQDAILDRVRALTADERIDDFEVRVWGHRIGLSTTTARTDAGRAVLDRLAAFRSWADTAGVSLADAFRVRETTTPVTGECHAVVDLPPFLLAEYREGELTHVTPHVDDGTVRTVADRLATLADRPANEMGRPDHAIVPER
ncbi:MAG: HTH domain-containing protein [Haloarculaceae archaeon]